MTSIDIDRVPKIVFPQACERPNPTNLLSELNEVSAGNIDLISNQNINLPRYRTLQQNDTYILYGERQFATPKKFVVLKPIPNDFFDEIQERNEVSENRSSVYFDLEENNQEEIEEAYLRGIQPINHQHKVLFTQEVEIKTSELRRWRPNIVLDPILFEDDE